MATVGTAVVPTSASQRRKGSSSPRDRSTSWVGIRKPVAVALAGDVEVEEAARLLEERGIPAYPYAAIRQGQQGRVVLEVLVDKGGRPTSVEIHQSSGFTLLDQSALWTVRRWKFDPAHVGPIPTSARIRVPIRFMLDKKE